jgi:argininosuccinate synthase
MPSTRLACAFLNVDDVIRSTILDQNVYLLGTSLARPVIARGMIAIADREGCE